MKRDAFRRLVVGLGAAIATATAAAPAAAQTIEQQQAPSAERWRASLGVRNTFVRSAGFDPFSANDVLSQVSFAFDRTFARHGAFVFAGGAAVDYGGSDAIARSAPSDLKLGRLALTGEARYYPWQRAYGFLRIAPGILRATAEVDDSSSLNGQPLVDRFDVLSIDASAGASVRLTGPANPVAAWISAEAGYGWAASHHLLLVTAAAPRDQSKLAPLDLGTIDPRGAFMRLAVAIAF